MNVTDASSVSNVVEKAVSEIRFQIRGVLTAGGISGEIDAVDYPAEDFRKLLDINVMGTFLVSPGLCPSGAKAREWRQHCIDCEYEWLCCKQGMFSPVVTM